MLMLAGIREIRRQIAEVKVSIEAIVSQQDALAAMRSEEAKDVIDGCLAVTR